MKGAWIFEAGLRFLLIAGIALIFSCASKPKPESGAGPETAAREEISGTPAGDLSDAADQDAGTAAGEAELVEGTVSSGELAEPEIDLAETGWALAPPEDSGFAGALPEPVPVQPPPVVPAPAASAPPPPPLPPPPPPLPPAPPPQAAPVQAESAPVTPKPEPRPPRPEPPAYLGPGEEDPPPAIVRDPIPVPLRPPPDPPAAIRPLSELWDEEAVFSRTVRATEGQLVEIPFRGTGWVYLGEIASRRGIVYESRRLDPEGQSFIFHAEAAGAYALQFYKQDFIREFILNDYVQVLVGEAPASAGSGWFNPPVDQGRVIAQPRWPASLDEARRGRRTDPDANTDAVQAGADAQADSGTARRETAAPASGRAVNAAEIAAGRAAPPGGIQTPPGVMRAPDTSPPPESPALASNAAAPVPRTMPPDFSPENFLQKAGEEFEAGKVASAIALLDQFRERYPAGSDEAYWLYGQFYEANSPSRDILAALDYYRRLVREYPQSGRYNDARRRIAYLERYYINIQ